MSHTIIYNLEEHVVEVTIQGDFSLSETKEIIAETIQIAKEQNCFLVLTDMREATMKLSMVEIYEFPKMLTAIFTSSGLSSYKLKRAFVAQKNLKEYIFFETVTLNRSQSIKYFFDMDKARKWLLGN